MTTAAKSSLYILNLSFLVCKKQVFNHLYWDMGINACQKLPWLLITCCAALQKIIRVVQALYKHQSLWILGLSCLRKASWPISSQLAHSSPGKAAGSPTGLTANGNSPLPPSQPALPKHLFLSVAVLQLGAIPLNNANKNHSSVLTHFTLP